MTSSLAVRGTSSSCVSRRQYDGECVRLRFRGRVALRFWGVLRCCVGCTYVPFCGVILVPFMGCILMPLWGVFCYRYGVHFDTVYGVHFDTVIGCILIPLVGAF